MKAKNQDEMARDLEVSAMGLSGLRCLLWLARCSILRVT
jgi:hypothetical protein